MKYFKPTRSVYVYYFPKVEEIIKQELKNIDHHLFREVDAPGLEPYHEGFVESFKRHFHTQVEGLDSFEYAYATNGSSEGIFHKLAEIKAKQPNVPLYIFEGEYEGYAGYGNNLGLKFTEVNKSTNFSELEKGIFFISNPSAIDGNILPKAFIRELGEAGHEIILDLCYLGTTDFTKFKVDYPYISTVFTSMSKSFGMYYYRAGITFSRKSVSTLEPNKWFKNILGIKIAKRILDSIEPIELYRSVKDVQQKAIAKINKENNLDLKPCDVFLLANQSGELPKEYSMYKRSGKYRFGLTPYFFDADGRSYFSEANHGK